jgi:hypothetical protein
MIASDRWLQGTAVRGRARSVRLRRLDAAIESRSPRTAKEAFGAWIADGREAWRTNQRNRTGTIQQLYDELGFGTRFTGFMDRLVDVTCDCRAGTRDLWVGIQGEKLGDDSQVWIDAGQSWRIDADMRNVARFYSTVKNLGDEVRDGRAPPDLVRVLSAPLPRTSFGTNQNFRDWARAAQGNCAERGTGDGVLWTELICRRTGFDYSRSVYRGQIILAQYQGEREKREHDAAKERLRLLRAGQIRLPNLQVLTVQGAPKYLTQMIRMNLPDLKNNIITHDQLLKAYNQQRDSIKRDIYGGEEDEELLSFTDAFAEARKQRI